jgi:hypothetical protein
MIKRMAAKGGIAAADHRTALLNHLVVPKDFALIT